MTKKLRVKIYFSEYFDIDATALHEYGAFNISLVNDLPLFIDPFLLFNSTRTTYQTLHEDIIKYVRFLRDKARTGSIDPGLLSAWYTFPEVKQTWLGFSLFGNSGTGLGRNFAKSLNQNLNKIFSGFDIDDKGISKSSHLEKLCLVDSGVGRDNISDFTTNLIKSFLLHYTEDFAKRHLRTDQRKQINVSKVKFDYTTEKWVSSSFELPYIGNDYVILTPRDLLTKDSTWINRNDLLGNMDNIANAVSDQQLRAEVSNYLSRKLLEVAGKAAPTKKQRREALTSALQHFPKLFDYYIRWKEDQGGEAETVSAEHVMESERLFIQGIRNIVDKLTDIGFYDIIPDTLEETRRRVDFFKNVIENQDGYRWFITKNDKPIRREQDLHLLFRLTWFATTSDVNREVNNGRGPVDFAISRGAGDKTLVEFKLASNSKLRQNLANQVKIYEQANNTKKSLKVIVFFTAEEFGRIKLILKGLAIDNDPNIILIDARSDNKPSGSKAK